MKILLPFCAALLWGANACAAEVIAPHVFHAHLVDQLGFRDQVLQGTSTGGQPCVAIIKLAGYSNADKLPLVSATVVQSPDKPFAGDYLGPFQPMPATTNLSLSRAGQTTLFAAADKEEVPYNGKNVPLVTENLEIRQLGAGKIEISQKSRSFDEKIVYESPGCVVQPERTQPLQMAMAEAAPAAAAPGKPVAAKDLAGSVIKIIGEFDAKGTEPRYGMQTTITFGADTVSYDGFGTFKAPLNGDPIKNTWKHTLTCGDKVKELIKEGSHPVYFQNWLSGTTYSQALALSWKDSARSRKCKDGITEGTVSASESIVIDFSGGQCRFMARFDMSKIGGIDADQKHVTVKGTCEASGPITKIGAL